MARLKKTLPFILALLLFVNFTAAQLDDDDEQSDEIKPTTVKADDIWKGKVCTISNAKATNYKLYMKNLWGGFKVSSKIAPKKAAKWIITPVTQGGKHYFEIFNTEIDTYVGATKTKARGNYETHDKTESTKTLFTIKPAKQNYPVSIQSYKGKYLNEPRSLKKKSITLEADRRTQWIIKCK